ncbi:MAG: hypothetical protein IPG04_11525 [Polyangiaceae bacterium]|jgi:hypothetical protein|nr:hypothetical protein [Polyangiaceae bacterium]
MTAPVHATPPTIEPSLRGPARGEDVLGWTILAVVVTVGLAWLFSPFKIPAIVISALAFVASVALIAFDVRAYRRHPALWVFGAILVFPATLLVLMHQRRRWGGTWLLPYAVVAVAAVVAGVVLHGKIWGPAARVTVSCRAAGDAPKAGYLCTPRHVGGYQSARACWDLALTCDNGTQLMEHVCAQVTLGEARESSVPFEHSAGVDDCDKISAARVDNLRVEVDPK